MKNLKLLGKIVLSLEKSNKTNQEMQNTRVSIWSQNSENTESRSLPSCKDILIDNDQICKSGHVFDLSKDKIEREKLEKDLEEYLQKLTYVIEGTNLGTWEWNIQTGELIINKEWSKMIGYTLEELQPINIETWNKVAHPEDLKQSYEIIERHLNGEVEYYSNEVRLKHRDGSWIWVHHRGKITERDMKGNPLKMFGTHANINEKKQAEENLKESEKRFIFALDKSEIGLWDYDMVSNEIYLSPMWKKLLGYSDGEIENSLESWKSLWHPDDKENMEKSMNDYQEGKSDESEKTYRLRHKDGSWRWISTRSEMIRDEKGRPCRWIGINIDVTKEKEQALELEQFFSVSLDLLCISDMEGKLIKINKAWEDILGYSIEELKGRNFFDFIHKDDIERTLEAVKQLKNSEKITSFVNRYITADGSYRNLEWKSNPHGDLIYAVGRDITDRVEYEKKILEISNRDSLTNIYNRRYVFNRLGEIIEECKRTDKIFSLSILDIDKFKNINDRYGHQIGDCVLKEFTKIIDRNLRPYDILGRYGGEEFIIILNNINGEESKLVIERILNIIRKERFTFNGENISFTFSAGISSVTEIKREDISIDKLVDIADKRMYEAKKNGRNQIIYK